MRRDEVGRRSGKDRECQCMLFWVRLILWATRNRDVGARPADAAAMRCDGEDLVRELTLPVTQ